MPLYFLRYVCEIYPTLIRNIGLGSSSTMARVGSIVAPMTFALHEVSPRFFPTGKIDFKNKSFLGI